MWSFIFGAEKIYSLFKYYSEFNTNSIVSDNMNHIDSEIISRLKFISKIEPNEKINIRHLFVQPDNITTKISRTFINPDTRKNTLFFIKTTVERSFELVTFYLKSSKPSEVAICMSIIKDIENSKIGIMNLNATYINDRMFCCDIETLLQNINARLSGLKEEYPELFPRDEDRPPSRTESRSEPKRDRTEVPTEILRRAGQQELPTDSQKRQQKSR